jgi:hypothetical protein
MKHRYTAIKQHLFSDLNNEAVILSMKSGKYYGLNSVGRSIWQAIKRPLTIGEIQALVMSEYEVDEDTCHREVHQFLQKMTNEGLIDILPDESAA